MTIFTISHITIGKPTLPNGLFRQVTSLCFVLGLIFFARALTSAQHHTDNNPDQTTRGEGMINASTLGLEISIPLAKYPGRGIDVPVTINYSSKVWRTEYRNSQPRVNNPESCIAINTPEFAEHSASGWTSSLAVPYIEYTGSDNLYDQRGHALQEGCLTDDPNNQSTLDHAYVKTVTVHLPGGETHQLRASDDPVIYPRNSNPEFNFDGIFYATDSSNLRYVENAASGRFELQMPDGSKYDFSNSRTLLNAIDSAEIRLALNYADRNGNTTQYNHSTNQLTDTIGRVFRAPFGLTSPADPTTAGAPQVYSLPGIGNSSVNYKFHWKRLKGATQAESAMPDILSPDYALKYVADRSSASPGDVPRDDGTYFFESVWNEWVHDEGQGKFNPVVLTQIELPTGVSYRFEYDNHGRIERLHYPTGASESYDYDVIPGLTPSEGDNVSDQTNFGVVRREIKENPASADSYVWDYLADYVAPSGLKITIITPEEVKTERFLIQGKRPDPESLYGNFGFENVLAGKAYEERVYDRANRLTLRKITHWTKTERNIGNVPGSPFRAGWHPRVLHNERIVFDKDSGAGLLARESFEYAFGAELGAIETPVLRTKAHQYAFSASADSDSIPAYGASPDSVPITHAPPTSQDLLRSSVNTFLIADPSLPLQTKQVYREKNIVGLITSTELINSAGDIHSKTLNLFDQSQRSPNGLVGNKTETRIWNSTVGPVTDSGAYISRTETYDGFGNVIAATDPLGNTTTTNFDAAHSVFPVEIADPVADSDGSNGASDVSVRHTEFDTATGLVLATTSPNGLRTKIEYEPGTFRLIRKTQHLGSRRVGGITETIYADSPGNTTVRNRKQISEQSWSEVIDHYDGLGRIRMSESVKVGGNVFVEKDFDSEGRISRVSFPYKTGESKRWTSNQYDDIGRVIEVTGPDGTSIQNDFGVLVSDKKGTTRTITDQAGRSRTGISDSLGRLVTAIEDPYGANLITDYVFDTAGNIREIRQGEQHRFFYFSSLDRLIYSKLPEQDLNPAHDATDPVTGNSEWADHYSYDKNGNITELRNARNIRVTASFDGFNRITNRTFSDETPSVEFFYDGTGVEERPARSRGTLTRVVSDTSDSKALAFDEFGRVVEYEQLIGDKAFRSSYEYDLGGALIAETYPSRRRMEYRFDPNGELSEVAGTKSGSVSNKIYLSQLTRNSSGLRLKSRLGNGRWNEAVYNSRDQIEAVRLGNSDGDRGLLELSFEYSEHNNGSMSEQFINYNGLENAIEQAYEYDQLNRLVSVTESNSGQESWREGYTFDRFGNREIDTRTTTTLADFNKVSAPRTESTTNRNVSHQDGDQIPDYVYDATGNLVRDAEHRRFGFDGENRVVSYFKSTNSSAEADAEYEYDGEGRRVRKVANDIVTVYVYNAFGKQIAEYSTEKPENPQIRYLAKDHLGSTRAVTDGAGTVLSRNDFLAFGESLTAKLGNVSGRTDEHGYGNPTQVSNQYTGYKRDVESGLDFAQARYYSAQQGRFTSVDPLNASANVTNPQSLNRYTYALNSPYKFVDPLGLISQSTGACGQYCSNVVGGGYNGGTVFDSVGGGAWLSKREIKSRPSSNTGASETVTPPPEIPIEAPQPLIAEATERLITVTVTGGGVSDVEGILQLSPEFNEIWITALNDAYGRGVRVGALAKASNGVAVLSSMTQGASIGGGSSGSISVTGPSGGLVINGGKTISTTQSSLGAAAVKADVDARAANAVSSLAAAGRLGNQVRNVSTTAGTVQAETDYGFINTVFTRELDLLYRRGATMGYGTAAGQYLREKHSLKPKRQ